MSFQLFQFCFVHNLTQKSSSVVAHAHCTKKKYFTTSSSCRQSVWSRLSCKVELVNIFMSNKSNLWHDPSTPHSDNISLKMIRKHFVTGCICQTWGWNFTSDWSCHSYSNISLQWLRALWRSGSHWSRKQYCQADIKVSWNFTSPHVLNNMVVGFSQKYFFCECPP